MGALPNDGIERTINSSPGFVMIHSSVTDFGIDLTGVVAGSCFEQCAAAAVNFMNSRAGCAIACFMFLESRNFSND